MQTLNLIINKNEITQQGNEYLTSGGYKSIECSFSFSREWQNLTKTAIFIYNGVVYNETIVENRCYIPYEAIENKGDLLIGVFGTEINGESLEKRNTTDLLNIKIYEGSFIIGNQPEKPSPETWELYLQEVNKLIEEANNKIDSFTAEDIKFSDGETFQEKYDNGEFLGTGEDQMKKSVYDTDNNGIVDNSEKVNNHIVESDVPANAIFTDTTYSVATKTNDGLMSASDKEKLAEHVAELDENGKVLSSQLPSYVDDVIEGTLDSFPSSGESGKIYVDIETNLSYRWTGSAYTVISPSIALGETSSTAYRGDRGKIAYDHSQMEHAPSNAEKNKIDVVKVNDTILEISDKSVNIPIPTSLSQLKNDMSLPGESQVGYENEELEGTEKILIEESDFDDLIPDSDEINITTGVEFATDWFRNGDRIYGMEIDCGFLTSGTVQIEHGLTDKIKELVHYLGKIQNTNSGTIFNIPRAYPTEPEKYVVDCDVSKSTINLTSGTNFTGTVFKAYVTIFYTKN